MAAAFADTSFLFSLFGGDAHTSVAQRWTRRFGRPIAVSALNRFEFENTVRFAAFRRLISKTDAEASLSAFHADLTRGFLQLVPADLGAVVDEAARLSGLYTLKGGHRSFDILHVATAAVLNADLLLTFDANQKRLAAAAKVSTGP